MPVKELTPEELEQQLAPKRTFTGKLATIVSIVAVAMTFFQLYVLIIQPIDPWILRSAHLTFAAILGFAIIPGWKQASRAKPNWIDYALMVVALIVMGYLIWDFDGILGRAGVDPTTFDVVVAILSILFLLELTRRATGLTLVIFVAIFFVYAFAGPFLPGILNHKGYSLQRTVSFLYSPDGIYGIPLGVSSTFVYMFVLFGAFLQVTGTGKVIIDLAWSVAGWARGGPAKMSVISSSLFGTISGSAVANVVVDGWLNIPMMKSVGYSAKFAGAVEALTSTGGQIMPPVMGAGAFLLADIVGVPYLEVAYAAAIPALLYYVSCYCMIDLEALKNNLKGLPKETLPNLKKVFTGGWHLFLPIIILLGSLIWLEVSPIRAGFYGSIAAIVASWLRRHTRINLKQVWDALDQAARGSVEIAATCGAAGIIIGIISLTGLGNKFANMLLTYAGDNLFFALVLTMIVALVLGMGVPTTAAYAICAATLAPGLVKLGINPLGAHLFIFYFAVLSCITPPVAVAAYAAAAIAKSSAWETGWTATRLGVAAFIVPYMFVFGPQLLGQGVWYDVVWAIITATSGIVMLSVAVQGWFFTKVGWLGRIASGAGALLLIDPGLETDIAGAILVGGVIVSQWLARKKNKLAAAKTT